MLANAEEDASIFTGLYLREINCCILGALFTAAAPSCLYGFCAVRAHCSAAMYGADATTPDSMLVCSTVSDPKRSCRSSYGHPLGSV